MKIAISGSSGLVGSALCKRLTEAGQTVFTLVRRRNSQKNSIYWNPAGGEIDREALEGFDAVIHLAGESISAGRWNATVKKRIRDSRVEGTTLLVRALSELKTPPRTFISASAMGYYGDRGDTVLTEDSAPDNSFLSQVCQEWEAAALQAETAGARVVCVRIGLVVSKDGGALGKMLPPFRLGLGGVVGSGEQYISWILLEDLVRIFEFVLEHPEIAGPVNAAAPSPVTNREWTKTLGRVLGRPTIFPLPSFAVRALMGEMGEALLLGSTRMVPRRLVDAGFRFEHPTLDEALTHELYS